MKKYLFIIMAVCSLVLSSCSNGERNEPQDIITNDELVNGIWVSALFYAESMETYMPIIDRSSMMGWKFEDNGTCLMVVGESKNTGNSSVFFYSLKNNKLTLTDTRCTIYMELLSYDDEYLEVIMSTNDSEGKMKCKLKKMEDA